MKWFFKLFIIFYSVNSTMFLPYRLFKKELQRVDCFREYLNYVKSMKKHDSCALRISFLEQCRDYSDSTIQEIFLVRKPTQRP